MAHNSDWLPSSRQEQLTMAQNWLTILQDSGTGSQTNAEAWGIPAAMVDAFVKQTSTALDALTAIQHEETRTPVATAACKTAFSTLLHAMRDIKKRWYYIPPLTEANYIGLGLKLRDTTPTASGYPTGQASLETYLVGRHQLGIKIVYLTGNPKDAANKGYRIWYTLVEHGGTPPVNPDALHKSFFTKKKKDVIDFEFTDSGKTAWFAVQIENEGKKGPWGPLVSALIP
jgi:hypothetical protein